VFSRDVGEAKLLNRHISERLPRLADHVRGWFPPELEVVLASCLAKDAEMRPENARVLAAQLRAIPIPPQHDWSDVHAVAWWANYQPKVAQPNVPASEVQVIMPGSAAEPTMPSHPFAETIVGQR
jgi:hypothetical protein